MVVWQQSWILQLYSLQEIIPVSTKVIVKMETTFIRQYIWSLTFEGKSKVAKRQAIIIKIMLGQVWGGQE